MRFVKMLVMVMAGVIAVAVADEVRLNNGSVIVGEVQQVSAGKVTVKTDFAGSLDISMSQVSSIKTSKPMNVKVDGKNATAKFDGDTFTVDGQAHPIGTQLLQVSWPADQPDPTLPKGRQWKYEAYASVTGKDGNVRKFDGEAGLIARMKGPEDALKLYAIGRYAKDNGKESEKRYILGADYAHRIAKSSVEWYSRAEGEYDRYNDKDPQITVAAGIGKYWIDRPGCMVRTRLGIAGVYHKYISEDKNETTTAALDANYHHEIKLDRVWLIGSMGTLITDVTFLPQFNRIDEYRVIHESSLSMPLSDSKNLNLRLGVLNDYYSKVAEEKKHMDTTYFAKIVYEWE